MKIDAYALAVSAAITAAILFVLCSLLVFTMPGMSTHMGGYMIHADFTGMQWQMSGAGFVAGLVSWSLCSAITAWLVALFYNRFTRTR